MQLTWHVTIFITNPESEQETARTYKVTAVDIVEAINKAKTEAREWFRVSNESLEVIRAETNQWQYMEVLLKSAIVEARQRGVTWKQIADVLQVREQTAWEKYNHLDHLND